jgi:hypothetical protein
MALPRRFPDSRIPSVAGRRLIRGRVSRQPGLAALA